MSKENEYRELFLAEALENHEELNRLITQLEKKPDDQSAINAIFRITHTLKGNAAGMGFERIAELGHTLETLFGEVREQRLKLNPDMFTALFKAIDTLGALIRSLSDGSKVAYKGIKTKLEVICRQANASPGEEVKEKKEVEEKPEEPAKSVNPVAASPKKTRKPRKKSTAQNKKKTATASELTKEDSTLKDEVATSTSEPTQAVAKKMASKTATEEKGVESSMPEPQEQPTENKIVFSDLVQVPVRKLDNLLNLVGELIIERDRIIASHAELTGANEYSRLNRISSDLQYSVMDVRLVQVGFLFNKFHRVVRDAATSEKKEVTLKLEGTDTEIDRNILQIISDSLIHLVRNCIAHGIEQPDARKQLGKEPQGTVTLKASNENDGVVIEIIDDGSGVNVEKVRERGIERGLISSEQAATMSDEEITMLIFEPGFSTNEQINAISGRGVGMDVVKKALDSVSGKVIVHSKAGEGTCIRLSLPSSMAVKGTLLFEANQTEYAIPLPYTEAVVSLYRAEVHKVGRGLAFTYQGKTVSLVFLKDILSLPPGVSAPQPEDLRQSWEQLHDESQLEIIVVSGGNHTIGLVVDKLLQRKEIVEKPLNQPVDQVQFISGVTILGNGNVCLVLHVPAIISFIFQTAHRQAGALS
ncbi:chemotaxis protein CheA [Tunicatimonas pelagia]|uniref:chemotaxis protein CheA n=1 Tax=Tunicatimonas pelagia TaxID=931531 RepID=UPI0026660665|nr:chemotaxis protein CheA [Tunicatimonas pelagia]WKN41383.1 chemotaxis protein CheA [Tunicatimonas pelagia]